MALLLTGFQFATAQTERGRWMVGTQIGGFTYSEQNNGGTKTISASLAPLAGYFMANNLLLGTGVPLSYSNTKPSFAGLITQTTNVSIGLSPFIRYYVGPSSLKPYVGLAYSYSFTNTKYETQTGVVSGDGRSTMLTPTAGVAYFINRNVALSAGLNYSIQTSESVRLGGATASAPAITEFTTNSKALSLNLGFQLFFGR